ncbi:hypothetical protein GC093_21615 [Paenibacillus sp. LMG 31456]|uniref:Uncharacterized protein n=1 Tax=Paenibacillus foliorum TaxID=2654974 RepID=A0A972GS09_9BACL|nr:hypothetical protein [Paenibacillus foliorum]NOU95801.1 hypothetical protein [Paenibacillus foliorum]
MIPFDCTWPYELIQQDVYVHECPFCNQSNVLLPLKRKDLPDISRGAKRLLVFPCCHNKITLVDADPDYLLASKPLRTRR